MNDLEARALVARFTVKDEDDHGKFDERRFVKKLKDQLHLISSNRTFRELDAHRPTTIPEPIEEHVKWSTSIRLQKGSTENPSVQQAHPLPVIELSGSEKKKLSYFETIIGHIRKGIVDKIHSMPKEDVLQNAFRLLSENRSPFLTPKQLKSACLYRLNVSLTDNQVATIFEYVAPAGNGIMRTKDLINLIIKEAYGDYKVTIETTGSPPKEVIPHTGKKSYVLNQSARVSYDHKFTGLVPPEKETAIYVPALRDLEIKIFDKISERTLPGANMYQQLVHSFSEGRDKTERHGISRDQMRFTLWKIFQLNVSNEVIEKLFTRYDKEKTGFILMERFCDGIMATGVQNAPLLEDPAAASDAKMRLKRKDSDSSIGAQLAPEDLADFLRVIRRSLRDKINRESRAPHYLINSVERMTKDQAMQYFVQKFAVNVDDKLLNELHKLYNMKGLFNMKLFLRDAMAVPDQGKLGKDPNLLAGGTVTADEQPTSLRGIPMSPSTIENTLANKISERLKIDQPMSSVHKIFKVSDTDGDVRYVNRTIMRNVLSKFDILPSDADFECFFRKNLKRSDGLIEVRPFLIALLTAGDNVLNPFLPKDPEEFTAQCSLAQVLSSMTGQMRRQVSGLTGPSYTRMVADARGVGGMDGTADEAKGVLEMAMAKTARAVKVQGIAASTHVGLSPRPPAGGRRPPAQSPSAMSSILRMGADESVPPKPRRPESAPPSLQIAQRSAHRSPRAKGHQLHVVTEEVAVGEGEEEEEEGGGEYYGGDEEDRARVEWEADNNGRPDCWSDVPSPPSSAMGSVVSRDWEHQQHRMMLKGSDTHKRGRPYTAAANDVVASRRIPHFNSWKKTDAYQDQLMKKYNISKKGVVKGQQEYGLFRKDLTRLMGKEQKLKEKYLSASRQHSK